jgi:hypothetical protein
VGVRVPSSAQKQTAFSQFLLVEKAVLQLFIDFKNKKK